MAAGWRKGLARLQSIGIDAVLIATLILMVAAVLLWIMMSVLGPIYDIVVTLPV